MKWRQISLLSHETKALGKRLVCLRTCLLKYPTDKNRYYQCSQLNKSAITFSDLSKPLLSIKIWRILLYNLACYRNVSIPSMHLILTTLHCLKIGDTVEFRWLKTRISIIVLLFILTQPAVNIAVNKIDIQRVKYHYLRDCVTIVWSLWHHQQSIMMSTAEQKPSEWDTGTMCKDHHFHHYLWICYVV